MSRAFTVYSKPNCSFCDRAKDLLTRMGEVFVEEDATSESNLLWLKSNGFRSVPQIYVESDDSVRQHVGGYDKLRVWLEANP